MDHNLWFLIFIMNESMLLENIVEKRHHNYNGEMLVIYVSISGFGGDNNLLASLKSRLSEARSFIIYKL